MLATTQFRHQPTRESTHWFGHFFGWTMTLLSSLVVSAALSYSSPSAAADSQAMDTASSPPIRCVERHGTWCLLQGASIKEVSENRISRTFEISPYAPLDHQDPLTLIAPKACDDGLSDRFNLLSLSLDQQYRSSVKDELKVRLNSNCVLTALLPRWTDDPNEWPYSGGLGSVRRCTNQACEGSTLADIVRPLATRYQRRAIRP